MNDIKPSFSFQIYTTDGIVELFWINDFGRRTQIYSRTIRQGYSLELSLPSGDNLC